MRVALDTTSLLGPRTGIGAFTTQLVELLPRDGVEVVAFGASLRGAASLPALLPPSVDVVRRPMAARPLRELWRRMDHPRIEFWTGAIDVVHGPNFVVPPSRGAEVVTVHDLTCVHHPELCTRDTLQVPALLRRAIRRGAWIHTVSQFVADEVCDHFAIPAERVRAIPNGSPVPIDPTRRSAAVGRARDLIDADRFILSLGTLEPRKDIPGLIAAFELVADDLPDLELVIAGPDGWGADSVSDSIARSPVRSRIRRLGWISDVDREALLAGAAAFVYPSLYEGFGLPPLEAIAAGTPVIATAVGALPEVLGDGARWVPPRDPQSLAAAITDVLADTGLSAGLVRAGEERRARFDWNITVDRLLDLYADARADSTSTSA